MSHWEWLPYGALIMTAFCRIVSASSPVAAQFLVAWSGWYVTRPQSQSGRHTVSCLVDTWTGNRASSVCCCSGVLLLLLLPVLGLYRVRVLPTIVCLRQPSPVHTHTQCVQPLRVCERTLYIPSLRWAKTHHCLMGLAAAGVVVAGWTIFTLDRFQLISE